MSKSKASETEVNEALAYKLAYWAHLQEVSSGQAAKRQSDDEFNEQWRNDRAFREKAYASVKTLRSNLAEAGLKVSASSSKKVQDTLTEIMTIPPRLAYSLPSNEAAPFDQSEASSPPVIPPSD